MTTARRLLMVVGTLALVLGLVAGAANRQLLDTSRFVTHADRVRQDPSVARHLALELSDRLIKQEPDLVAVRPLLEAGLQSAIVSPAFRPAFRAAVKPLHQAWTGGAPSTVVLRVADIGAVVVAVTRAVLPAAAQHVPTDLEVRLARFGSGSAARNAVGAVRLVRLLGWLCPVIALLCFGGAVALARDRRRRTLRSVGMVVVAVGVGLALATVLTTLVLSRAAPDTLGGALTQAAWRQLAPSVRDTALVAAGAGYLLVVGAGLSVAGAGSPRRWLDTTHWRALASRSPLGTATAMIVVGGLLATEPIPMLTILGIAAGLVLALHGVVGLVTTLADRRRAARAHRGDESDRPGRPVVVPIVALIAVAVLAGLVVWNSSATTTTVPGAALDTTSCDGYPQLCGRAYDDVAFPATHNSMAAADQPGWFLAEQPNGVIDQLDAGVRAFLIDAWEAQPTQRPGVVVNTDGTHARALAQAEADVGEDVVRSALRLRQAARLDPTGPAAPYLCHALCVLGATRWEPLMARVRAWLDEHPREVVTFIIQDEEVPPAEVADVFQQAGLMPAVYTPDAAGDWPTLEQMIDSGHRVVVMAENRSGGSRYPWLLPAFGVMQETPFLVRRVDDFSCRRNRGTPDARLFLVNHWLSLPLRRVRASRLANSDAVLGPRLDTCEKERGQIPNFVAVDYYNEGDLFGQVRRLNGLTTGPVSAPEAGR